MKKGKTLFILCSAAFCFTLALAGCQQADTSIVPSESETSESQSETSESQSGQETATYTVKFNSNGGSPVADQKVKKGDKAKKPTDPTKEGYSFVNWFEDTALATVFDFNQAIVSDLTLYAKWNKNDDPGPGPGPQPEQYEYYVVLGSTSIGLTADSGTLVENQIGQWSKSGVSVTAGQTIGFKDTSNATIRAGSDVEDAANKNNISGSFDDGYTIHNDATATVTLKGWQDGGYSFWITGYEDGGVTPVTDYFVSIGGSSYTLTSVALDPTDPENMVAKLQCEIESVSAGAGIVFYYGENTIQAGSDVEDEFNKNNISGSFDDGYTIHNDATDVWVTLKAWQDGGYSFWITGYDNGGVTPPTTQYYVSIGANNYALTSVALDATDPENMTGKYQCEIESVSTGLAVAFFNGENAIQAGSDVEDETNKNNISGSFEGGYAIHNDAIDVWVTLKSWQDGGYSFWITGYDDSGVTPTNDYSVHLDDLSFTLTSVALDATDPENMTGKYQCQLSAVSAGQAVSFYHGTETIRPGSDVEDDINKNNISGSYDDGYTIHNDATDVWVTLKSWQDGGYSFWITGYVAGTPDPTAPYGPEGSELVSWYIVGQGSLWEWPWDIYTSVQLYSNPNNPTDLGCVLNVTFAVDDRFKVTDGDTWYGYDKVDPWDDPSNMGLHAFEGVPDGVSEHGLNFRCTTAGTYDIYVKENGKFWIQAHS